MDLKNSLITDKNFKESSASPAGVRLVEPSRPPARIEPAPRLGDRGAVFQEGLGDEVDPARPSPPQAASLSQAP